jgi:hypothetical protein
MREQLRDPRVLSQLGIHPAHVEFYADEKLVAIRR